MITHFIIEELPNPAALVTQVNGINAVIDTLYPIALENTLTWTRTDNPAWPAVPLGVMKYKVTNGTQVSNVAEIDLRFVGHGASIPSSVDVTIARNNNTPIVLGLHMLTWFNASKMRFTNLGLVPGTTAMLGSLKLNGNDVVVNQEVPLTELNNLIYTPLVEGGGIPYAKMSFESGNTFMWDTSLAGNNILTINIGSTAILTHTIGAVSIDNENVIVNGVNGNHPVLIEPHTIAITKGHSNRIAEVQFTINSPFLSLNDVNRIVFTVNGVEIEKFVNEVFTIDVPLDELGSANISIDNIAIRNVPTAIVGEVKIDVLKMDGNGFIAIPINEITINTNIL